MNLLNLGSTDFNKDEDEDEYEIDDNMYEDNASKRWVRPRHDENKKFLQYFAF